MRKDPEIEDLVAALFAKLSDHVDTLDCEMVAARARCLAVVKQQLLEARLFAKLFMDAHGSPRPKDFDEVKRWFVRPRANGACSLTSTSTPTASSS